MNTIVVKEAIDLSAAAANEDDKAETLRLKMMQSLAHEQHINRECRRS